MFLAPSFGIQDRLGERCSVTLADPFSDGHHLHYARTLAGGLSKAGWTIAAVGDERFLGALRGVCDLSAHRVTETLDASSRISELQKAEFVRLTLQTARQLGSDVTHFLQLDRFILSLLCSRPFGSLAGICATLHWATLLPEFTASSLQERKAWILRQALQSLLKRGMRLMVHSPMVETALRARMASDAVNAVPYPVDIPPLPPGDREVRGARFRGREGIPPAARVLLCFGGTRHDKGADIALAALAHLPADTYLLVAGREEHFTRVMLEERARSLGVHDRLRLSLRFIPDDELIDCFLAADVVLLPYRGAFPGQSGPLTIAGGLGKPVVSSSAIVLKETVAKYGLGATFGGEDPSALASAVEQVFSHPAAIQAEAFLAQNGPEAFCNEVLRCYSKVVGSIEAPANV